MSGPPEPPYYAVIFTNQRTDADSNGYAKAAERMMKLATAQPGFMGVDSVRGSDGFGITVSYWDSVAAIENWKNHPEHADIQKQGRETWYAGFSLRVARVERVVDFSK